MFLKFEFFKVKTSMGDLSAKLEFCKVCKMCSKSQLWRKHGVIYALDMKEK